MKTARGYQEWCLYGGGCHPGIRQSLIDYKSTIVVMATGLGKSFCIARVAKEWEHGNVLCLAHRIELVDQLAETLAAELGYRPIIEQGDRGVDPDGLYKGGMIVVGSIQSMITERRRRKFRNHPFGLIVIDECHRAASASYAKLVDMYRELDPMMRVLGVTATPNRTDGVALGLVFESVAFEMPIVTGIDTGWLVDIHQSFAVLGDVDLDDIQVRRNEFGEVDFKAEDLERVLTQDGPLHSMSHAVMEASGERQAIIFAASVNHAHVWAAVLNNYKKGCAAAVDGETPKEERKRIVYDYKSGELQFLLNFDVFSEGFDAPNTGLVIMGRPTKSLLKYTQFLGRCTRAIPGTVDGIPTPEGRKDAIAASLKPHADVLDFVGNSKHKLVSATDVLGGNYDVDLRAIADDILGAKPGNVRDAIAKAKAGMLLAIEERKRMGIRTANPGTKFVDINPFEDGPMPVVSKAHKTRGGSTDNQVALLMGLGVEQATAEGYSRSQAGAVITNIGAKRCTDRQAKTLKKYGYDPLNFNYKEASAQIQKIADNGWKRPSGEVA